jgi:hypothetical protein
VVQHALDAALYLLAVKGICAQTGSSTSNTSATSMLAFHPHVTDRRVDVPRQIAAPRDVVFGALLERLGLRALDLVARFAPYFDRVLVFEQRSPVFLGFSRASASINASVEPSPISRDSGFPFC